MNTHRKLNDSIYSLMPDMSHSDLKSDISQVTRSDMFYIYMLPSNRYINNGEE